MAAWLSERRRDAAERNSALPVPTIREEHWRYTNLRGIDFAGFRPAPEPDALVVEAGGLLLQGHEAGRVVMRDALVVREELAAELAVKGVIFTSLAKAAEEHAALVEPHLDAIVKPGSEKFATQSSALWTDGVFVYVPAGVEIEAPLHATFEIGTEGAAQEWRMLVVAEANAKLTLVEEHAEGLPGFANGVVEVFVGDGAKVEHVQIQDRSKETLHFAFHRAVVQRDAQLDWVCVAVGGRLGKTWMQSELAGAGSNVKLTGSYVLDGERHLDLDTTQEHTAPHATSDLHFKGALSGKSRSVWRGIIKVAEGAQKTDAYQDNRNLLLSPRAHADSIPGLEIKANDVRCTHGATIGPVDKTMLFYLMSRGIERSEAERIIVRAFFADTLERIDSEPVREAVARIIDARLP